MDIIGKEKFEKANQFKRPDFDKKDEITEEDFNRMLEEMQNPVDAQRRLAVQIKMFLDDRIEKEMKEKGILSDHTRRWVESYNNILEKLQKSLFGDKSVNLHIHKVTHALIATKIREAEKLIIRKKEHASSS